MRVRQKIQLKIGQATVHGLSVVDQGLYGVSLNIFDPALAEDPYPFYNRMRNKAPIHYSIALRAWWVTAFDLVQQVLRDKRFGSDVREFSALSTLRRQYDATFDIVGTLAKISTTSQVRAA